MIIPAYRIILITSETKVWRQYYKTSPMNDAIIRGKNYLIAIIFVKRFFLRLMKIFMEIFGSGIP
ncbi:MAG TPA: hypothetical protein DIT62_01870 [Alphaproteobacteria bacterium]|nr:hypothetical protein [Alphaproteobacteria bacterium]